MRTLLFAALFAPALALADGAVLLFPAIGTPTQVTIAGRVLKDVPSKGSSTFSKNLRRLMASNWEGAKLDVHLGSETVSVTSMGEGAFEAVFTPKKPFPAGVQIAEANLAGAKTATAAVEILSPDSPFFVISDFDDTVAVSEVLDPGKLLTNALLRDEASQLAVNGMPEFYRCLRAQPGPPPFALVSGSPIQFAPRVGAFLAKNSYPPMALYLRDLNPGTLSNYKQPIIRVLLKRVPNAAVCIGDSGEHDPEVYKQISTEFPGRVKRIYIRNAGHAEDLKRFEGMFFFKDPKEAALDAVAHGLASKECVSEAFP